MWGGGGDVHLLRKYCFVSLWSSGAGVGVAALGRGKPFFVSGKSKEETGTKARGQKEKIKGLSPFPLN